MSLLFTVHLLDANLHKKAPINTMFKVESVHFAVVTATTTAFVFVVDRDIEAANPDRLDLAVSNLIAVIQHGVGNHLINDIDILTKHLTFGKSDSAGTSVMISVYGEIVPATRKQLLIEWFRKR